MRKGESPKKYACSPFHFVPDPQIYFPLEQFLPITEQAVPGIKPYYMISNYGRIWHVYDRRFLSANMDSKGYLFKPLATINGMKNCRIHRLVMLVFCYFPGCENLLVNHKDGIKTNCFIWNLEWATYSENTQHAIDNGLMPVAKSNYSYDQIHQVCELLQQGEMTLQQVADKTEVSYGVVQGIQNKRIYTDISDKYNIQPRKINNNLSLEEVNALCLYFQNNPKDKSMTCDQYCAQALLSIGIKETGYKFIKTAKKIYWKETYQYVSCNYNF